MVGYLRMEDRRGSADKETEEHDTGRLFWGEVRDPRKGEQEGDKAAANKITVIMISKKTASVFKTELRPI